MKTPPIKSLKFQILMLAVSAGLISLTGLELARYHLGREVRGALEEARQEYRQAVQAWQTRLMILVVAHRVCCHLKRSEARSWRELHRDPTFRRLAFHDLATGGQTFLLARAGEKMVLYRRGYPGGQDVSGSASWSGLKRKLRQVGAERTICELEVGTGPCPSRALLVPVPFQLPGGPELMVGGLFQPGRTDLRPAVAHDARGSVRFSWPPVPMLLFLAGLGVLWLLASLTVAWRHSRQMAALSKAANAFNAGDLSYRLPPLGENELGMLAGALNGMAAGLQENTVSRAEWEKTFDLIPDQIMVLDTERRVRRLNRAAAAYLGVAPEAAVGRFCYELYHKRSAPLPSCSFGRAIQPENRGRVEYCFDAGERSFLVTIDPWENAAGEICGAVHVARDVTTLKAVEQKLAQTSEFLNQIFETTPVALGVVNRQGRFTRVNPQFFPEYGYEPQDLLGQHYSIIYAGQEELDRVLGELREKGQVLSRYTYFRHKNGQVVPTRISIRKLRGPTGEVTGSVAVGRNISDEVSLQRQLEQAQKLETVATLSGGLAHNFNNQLTVIMGLTNLMLSRLSPEDDFYQDLKAIEQQVQAGRELTQKLLTFARGSTFRLQSVDLNDLVKVTADMLARTRRDLVVVRDLAPGLLPVMADPGQVQQVLLNLLINAWQSLPGTGEITITTSTVTLTEWTDPAWDLQPGAYGAFSVIDNGVGMDETVLSRIFEPLFTTKKPGQGSGLGLASAYRIIKAHGGAILVTSQPGQGSTFTVYLPVSSTQPEVLTVPDSQLIPGHATILVVDDEPVLRRVTTRLLIRLGYRVLEASGGEEALELFQAGGPEIDLVLLDLIMPGLNGVQVLERLRELKPGVRVLLCSGYGDKAGEEIPPDVGFIAKPYSLEALSQKVAAALKDDSEVV